MKINKNSGKEEIKIKCVIDWILWTIQIAVLGKKLQLNELYSFNLIKRNLKWKVLEDNDLMIGERQENKMYL